MKTDLAEEVEKIKTREDLANFLGLVLEDYQTNRDRWENDTLERFLSALEGFTKALVDIAYITHYHWEKKILHGKHLGKY